MADHAPKWTVTAWREDDEVTWTWEDGRWYLDPDYVDAEDCGPHYDVEDLRKHHGPLRPVDVDDVAALLADFHDLDAEHAKTVSNFEEHAEGSLERAADLQHEIDVLRSINREVGDGNLALNQLVLDTQRERDEARAGLAALAPGWESPAALQAAYSEILALYEAAVAERDRALEKYVAEHEAHTSTAHERDQARRDAASWEDWGRGWKAQSEANQVERDKAWAEVDRLRPVVEAARAVWICPIGEAEPHLAAMFDAINKLATGTVTEETLGRLGSHIGTEPVEVDP